MVYHTESFWFLVLLLSSLLPFSSSFGAIVHRAYVRGMGEDLSSSDTVALEKVGRVTKRVLRLPEKFWIFR
jgi:hypothetical protein